MDGEVNGLSKIDYKNSFLYERYDSKAMKTKKYALFLSFDSTKDSHPFLKRVEIPEGTVVEKPSTVVKKTKRHDTEVNPNWNVSLYNQERTGVSTIFNFGEGSHKQSASYSTDVLFGTKITEDEDKGFFFDANVGVRYDVGLEKSTPNRHRGGVVGEVTLGYKMPVYKSKNVDITFDNYTTASGYYCSSGHNGIDSLERSGFVSGLSNEESSKKEPYLRTQLQNYISNNNVPDACIFIERTNFDGSTTLYTPFDLHSPNWTFPSGGGKAKDPKLNPYSLKGGIGAGFSFNVKPEGTDDSKLSVYLGVEAGVHKTGPKFSLDSHDIYLLMYNEGYYEDYKGKTIYASRNAMIVDNGKFDKSSEYYHHYESNVHEKSGYVSYVVNANYSWDRNTNQKEVFLNVDQHGVYAGFRANLFGADFDGNTNRRPK